MHRRESGHLPFSGLGCSALPSVGLSSNGLGCHALPFNGVLTSQLGQRPAEVLQLLHASMHVSFCPNNSAKEMACAI